MPSLDWSRVGGGRGTGKRTEIQNLRRGRRNKSSVGLFLGRSASFKTSHIKRDRGNECPAPLRDKPTSNKARQNAKAAGGKNPLLLCSAARIPLRRRRCPSALASSPRSSYYARSCGGASCRVADHGCRRPGGPGRWCELWRASPGPRVRRLWIGGTPCTQLPLLATTTYY